MAKLRLIDRWAAFTDDELRVLERALDDAESHADADYPPVAVEGSPTRSTLRSSVEAQPAKLVTAATADPVAPIARPKPAIELAARNGS